MSDTPDWYQVARQAARAVAGDRPAKLPGIRPLEHQLADAINDLGDQRTISDCPNSVSEWDQGADTAEAIAEIATRLACIAHALVIDRVKFRADFLAKLQERAMSDDELYGSPNHKHL